jgi:hypothetical protein
MIGNPVQAWELAARWFSAAYRLLFAHRVRCAHRMRPSSDRVPPRTHATFAPHFGQKFVSGSTVELQFMQNS